MTYEFPYEFRKRCFIAGIIIVPNKYAKQSRVVTSEKNKRVLQTAGEFLYNLNHAIKL